MRPSIQPVIVDVRANLPGPPESPEPLPARTVTCLILHHSQTARREGLPFGDADSIFQYQAGFYGWDTIGYHYIIGRDGRVEYALSEQRPGRCDLEKGLTPAQRAANAHGLHICLVGWFDQERTYLNAIGGRSPIPPIHTHPALPQRAALLGLLQLLRARYALPVEAVQGHRELDDGRSRCPGATINLDELRAELAELALPVEPATLPRLVPAVVATAPVSTSAPRYVRLKALIYGSQRWMVRLVLTAALVAWLPAWLPAWRGHWLLGLALTTFNALTLLLVVLRWYHPPTWAYARLVQRMMRAAGQPPTLDHQWVPLAEMSPWLLRAALATEDPHFFEHAGLAWGHVLFALRHHRAGQLFRGASTITQQLVKNLFLWPARTYLRKGVEVPLAMWVEAIWPKARILELYLNLVQLGVGVFGAEAASQRYLHQPAASLQLEAGALLVAVLANPVLYQVQAPSLGVLGRRDMVRRNTLAYAEPALDRLVQALADRRTVGGRPAEIWQAAVLAYRVLALRVYLKRQGIYSAVSAQYRPRRLAHRWSTAYHLATGHLSLGALRQLPEGRDWDGTVWYQAAWDSGAPAATPASSVPALAANAARLGPPNLNYAEEGYSPDDVRRLPNLWTVPVSRHVAGQALDLTIDWAPLGGPESEAAQALVARFGLTRPVPAETWHFEARRPFSPGVSPLPILGWGLARLTQKALGRQP